MLTDPTEDYARGWIPFLDTKVYLDSHPLIPRTETEYWVERAIAEMLDVRRPTFRVLDLFAGSGAIGLAVLKHVPKAHVTFAEKETRHFPTIQKSLRDNHLTPDIRGDIGQRATIIQTDVWTPMKDVRRPSLGRFDCVLANPPYGSEERGTASAEVLVHEPREALFAAKDGFYFIEKTILGLAKHLTDDGIAYIEHEPHHLKDIETLGTQCGFSVLSRRDQYGNYRFSRLSSMA